MAVEDIFSSTMGGLSRIMNPASSGFGLNKDPERQALENQIGNLQSKLSEAGIDPALQEPRENLFWKALNVIAKPMQMVEGVADAAFVRGDIGRVGLFGAMGRGMEERISGSDILRRAGIKSPIARGVAGFGLDMILDPVGLARFGTKGLSTAGGLLLSAKGNKLRQAAELTQGRDLAQVLSKIDADKLLDDAAKASASADVVTQYSKNLFEGFKTLGAARRDAADAKRAITGLEKTMLTERAQRFLDTAQSKLRIKLPSDVNELDDLIAKPTVRFELGVPLLGHITGKAKRTLPASASKAQKVLTEAGNILNADTLKLGEFTIPAELGESLRYVGDIARHGIADIKAKTIKALDSVKDVPYLGDATQKLKSGTEAVVGFGKVVGKAFQNTFMRNYVLGETARDAELAKQAYLASLDTLGQDELLKVFPMVASEEGRTLMNGVAAKVDALAFGLTDEFTKTATKIGQENLVKNLTRLAKGLSLPEGTFKDMDALEPVFRERFKALLTTMSPEEQEIANRMVNSFDVLFQKEAAHGAPLNFFEYYLPHRFENLNKKSYNPSLQRSFATLGEAFDRANLVGSTDLGSLWLKRWKITERKIAEGQYFNRMVLENGFNIEDTRRLYQAARFQPDEGTAALMDRARKDPKLITKEIEKLFAQEKLSKEARQSLKNLGLNPAEELTPSQVTKGESLSKLTKDTKAQFGKISKLPTTDKVVKGALERAQEAMGPAKTLDPELEQAIVENITRFSDEGRASHFLSSIRPMSNEMPDPYYKEMADFVEEVVGPNGEKVTHVLPVQIANALKENLKSKDVLREALGNSPLGSAVLNLLDGATDTFKRWNTLPWPGYWSQNMMGDTVMRWIDGGINATSPGLLGKTFNLINDPAATITLPNGVKITGRTFQELLKRNGIAIDAKEMIDTINAAGDLNIEKWARKNSKNFKGHIKAIGTAEKGGVPDALTSAREFMTKNFENVFRVNHVLHRLEMGDTIGDAMRNATEAMINYRDFTDIEKSILRRFYFFYGWTSKAIKKQALSLFTNPGDIRHQVTLAKNFAETFSEPGALPTADEREDEILRSLTEREQLSFSLGKNKEGKEIIGRGFGMPLNVPLSQFSITLPRTFSVSEIIHTVGDNIGRNLQKQAATANPLITAAAEGITGKNLYFDKPLDAKFLRKLPDWTLLAQKVAPFKYSQIPAEALNAAQVKMLGAVPDGKGNYIADPGLYYLATHLIPGFGRGIGTARALSSPTAPTSLGALRGLTGLRFEENDIERSALFDERTRLQDLMNKYSVKERLDNE